MPQDYYEILGVDPDADEKGIKKAYRNIIKYCHPDSPDCRMTTEELLKVQEAYENLADPEKRARYDRKRKARHTIHDRFTRRGSAARAGPSTPYPDDGIFDDIFSLFDDPFDIPPARYFSSGGLAPEAYKSS